MVETSKTTYNFESNRDDIRISLFFILFSIFCFFFFNFYVCELLVKTSNLTILELVRVKLVDRDRQIQQIYTHDPHDLQLHYYIFFFNLLPVYGWVCDKYNIIISKISINNTWDINSNFKLFFFLEILSTFLYN